jgi:NitT/TauT family transport system ATP-binding protein
MADRVLIMSANPGRIVGEMSIDLPFPRNRASAEFSHQREQLMTQFEDLVGSDQQTTPLQKQDIPANQQAA